MKIFQGGLRTAFLMFFISHIPITLLIDGQGCALRKWYPKILQDLVRWYAEIFGDVLMGNSPSDDLIWFSSVIYCELLFQLPFFFVAAKTLLSYPSHNKTGSNKNDEDDVKNNTITSDESYPNWFRLLCLIYGSHVTTTLIPILSTFIMSSDMSTIQKSLTISVYSPYLIFPLLLMWFAAREVFFPIPKGDCMTKKDT
jgi:hypothetical protein